MQILIFFPTFQMQREVIHKYSAINVTCDPCMVRVTLIMWPNNMVIGSTCTFMRYLSLELCTCIAISLQHCQDCNHKQFSERIDFF